MPTLRLSLTISGAVALGAYEGGALAALLYAARSVATGDDPPLVIDVMSGASAGSITALLAARALLQGHDPCTVMAGAWVKGDSIGGLLAHNSDAPLSIDALHTMACDLLNPAAETPSKARQAHPVRLSYTLACLRGLEYRLPRLGRGPILAATNVDYYDHTLAGDDSLDSLLTPHLASPLDAVLASAANAMGFPPYLLDREAVWAEYVANGVDNLPPYPHRSLWFTDGGTLANEPLGRTLDLANAADRESGDGDQRLHLLIHPHPTAAIRDLSWADPEVQPTFVQTALRALGLQRSQSLYADLKQVEKTNTRISRLDIVCRELGPALEELGEPDRSRVASALAHAAAAMSQANADMHAQRTGPAAPPQAGTTAAPADAAGIPEMLARLLSEVGGLGGKRPARVDVISPLLLEESQTHSVEELLSGEVLFHFGGFLDENMRRNDFDLGYSSTLAWLKSGGLVDAGLAGDLAARASAAALSAYTPGDGWKKSGSITVGSLLRMHPWQAARVVAKITQVLVHDLVHHPQP